MTETLIGHECSICGAAYATAGAARLCATTTPVPPLPPLRVRARYRLDGLHDVTLDGVYLGRAALGGHGWVARVTDARGEHYDQPVDGAEWAPA